MTSIGIGPRRVERGTSLVSKELRIAPIRPKLSGVYTWGNTNIRDDPGRRDGPV